MRKKSAQRRLVRSNAFGKPDGLISGGHGVSRGLGPAHRIVSDHAVPVEWNSGGIAVRKFFSIPPKQKRDAYVVSTGVTGTGQARSAGVDVVAVAGIESEVVARAGPFADMLCRFKRARPCF